MAVERYESLNGAEKAAILMLSVGEDSAAKLFSMLDLEEVMDISQTMSQLGRVRRPTWSSACCVEFVDRLSAAGRPGRRVREHRAAPAPLPRPAAGRAHHGGDPRSRRPHHVGQARQRERGGARQLPEERIPADRRGRAVEDRAGARRARAPSLPEDFALECVTRMLRMEPVQNEILDKVEQTLRTEFMSQPGAQLPARQPRDDGGHLQQLRPPDREPASSPPWRSATARRPSGSGR